MFMKQECVFIKKRQGKTLVNSQENSTNDVGGTLLKKHVGVLGVMYEEVGNSEGGERDI